jgi:hypothetical protein
MTGVVGHADVWLAIMTPLAAQVLQIVETLANRLTKPITEEMRAGGWRDESAHGMSEALDEFAAKIRIADDLPPSSERLRHMARGLDMWGIHGGGPYDELLALERSLEQAP